VAYDAEGNLYVADGGGYRIVVFSSDGKRQRAIGKPGSGDGQLNVPTGLCVAGDSLLVCDTNNGRIGEFKIGGDFVRTIGGLGIATGKLAMPNGVAVSEKWIWVANTRGHVVQRYAPDSGVIDRAFGYFGDDGDELAPGTVDYKFRQPKAVACGEGLVFVLDSKHNRILVIDEDGALQSILRPEWNGIGLARAEGLAMHLGVLYVADTGNNRVLKVTTDGKTIDAITGLQEPVGIAGHYGRLAVSSPAAAKVWEMEMF